MNKVKTLANKIYYIIEEDDVIEDVIDSMKEGQIVGSKEEISNQRLEIDNICSRMIKTISQKDCHLEYKVAKLRDAKDIARMMNKNMIDVPNTVEYKKRFVEILINGGYNEFLYIYDEGDCIGLVELCYEEDIPEITSIIVYDRYRHQGYGKQILQLIENRLIDRYQQVTIVVSDHNEVAYHLYTSFGYQKEEDVMYYYRRLS